MTTLLIIGFIVIAGVIGLVVIALRREAETGDPLQDRLAEFAAREENATLQEIEMSQPFSERILWPFIRRVGQIATNFTPEATLESARAQLERAGVNRLGPSEYLVIRIAMGAVLAVFIFIMMSSSEQRNWGKITFYTLGAVFFGYMLPSMYMTSKSTARKDETVKALPDALDLITICVEAGLGFDGAMGKVAEKWDNELAAGFARVIQEINLGKPRREALKNFSDRMEVDDLTSFIAAVLQADQLGVSMGRVLRIQSEQMRIKRRQRAEAQAQKAPIKMLFPMVGCIFPAIFLVLMGPAVFVLLNSGALSIFVGG